MSISPEDVKVVIGDEVVPAAREANYSTDSEPGDATELTDVW
jgi:hypothetical protein